MLSLDFDRQFNIIPTVKNQIFDSVIKLSMKRIISYIYLPLNFNSDELEIWRFSAPFYGFYYDMFRKNYTLWTNIMLKKNYGFVASLFFNMKNYKRFWNINANSWMYYSYLFKPSFSKDVGNLDVDINLYNSNFHNSLDKSLVLFESSEIAILSNSMRFHNNWLIQESMYELDHTISTYDRYRQESKYNSYWFPHGLKNFYNFVDSSFLQNSLYTLGYNNNNVIRPKSYFEARLFIPYIESVMNMSFFSYTRFSSSLRYFYDLKSLQMKNFLVHVDIFHSLQLSNLLGVRYLLYKIFGSYGFAISPFYSKYINLPMINIFKLYGWSGDLFSKRRKLIYRYKYKLLSKWDIRINKLKKFRMYKRKFSQLKRKIKFSQLKRKIKLYKHYYLSNLNKRINNKSILKSKLFVNSKYDYYWSYSPKTFKSWIITCRWDLSFILARFGNNNQFPVMYKNTTVFMKRPRIDIFKQQIFYKYFYIKTQYFAYMLMMSYINKLIKFVALLKWNFNRNFNIFYSSMKSKRMNKIHALFVDFLVLFVVNLLLELHHIVSNDIILINVIILELI